MDMNEYQRLAMVTKKPQPTVKEQITDALLGLGGESGEVLDIFKKSFAGVKEISADDLKKELGDVLWYLAEMCDAMGFELGDVAERNIAKLKSRHGDKFSGYGNRTGAGK